MFARFVLAFHSQLEQIKFWDQNQPHPLFFALPLVSLIAGDMLERLFPGSLRLMTNVCRSINATDYIDIGDLLLEK